MNGFENLINNKVKQLKKSSLTAKDIFAIQGLAIKGENPILFDKYISEKEDVLNIIVKDNDNYNIVCKMGGGKSIGLSKFCHENNIKAIIAVPLKMNAEQTVSMLRSMFQIEV